MEKTEGIVPRSIVLSWPLHSLWFAQLSRAPNPKKTICTLEKKTRCMYTGENKMYTGENKMYTGVNKIHILRR